MIMPLLVVVVVDGSTRLGEEESKWMLFCPSFPMRSLTGAFLTCSAQAHGSLASLGETGARAKWRAPLGEAESGHVSGKAKLGGKCLHAENMTPS